MARAERRDARWHGRIERFRIRTMDFIGGAPTKAPEIVAEPSGDDPAASSTPPENVVSRDGATS
jgi:hypothetical protein